MKIKTLGCYGGQLPGKNLTAFLLNGDTLIDAGTIGLAAEIKEQKKIKNIFLSHAHLDHTGGIPFYAVNIVSNKTKSVNIAATQFTLDAIQNHLMNNITWPDFTKIKNFAANPVFAYLPIVPKTWVEIGGYKILAIPVNHTIPTVGFLIGKGNTYMLYSGDTKDTDEIWIEAKKLGKKLKAAFIEVAFPDEVAFLAESSCHLTPKTLELQLKKLLPLKPKIYLYHLKPEYIKEIKKGLKKIKDFKVKVLEDGVTYKI